MAEELGFVQNVLAGCYLQYAMVTVTMRTCVMHGTEQDGSIGGKLGVVVLQPRTPSVCSSDELPLLAKAGGL